MSRTGHGRTRRALLAAVGATGVAALAGCSGDDQSTASEAETPGSSPTASPQSTATPESIGLPPGTSESGIDDASALVSATQSALRSTDYAIESVVPLGGESTVTTTIRSSPSQERYLYVHDSPSETNRRYVADGTSHIQATAGGETSYSTDTVETFATVHEDNDQVRLLGDSEGLGGILDAGSYAPAGTVTRDGRRLHEFALESADLAGGATAVTADGGAFVDAEGVVFEASLPYTPEGSGATVEWSFTVLALGDVSVREPDWVRSG
ncbi:hypothetical protein [Haloarcula sediminis]|uniref:hypothetical protein n=1 Tax=Haloarcula sediminis TaxID=3111777 RepID=UPI002D76FEC0|nr:hypothetical protein [Haloarcula sp. CK38]